MNQLCHNGRLEAIASRVEAIAIRLPMLEAIAIRLLLLLGIGHKVAGYMHDGDRAMPTFPLKMPGTMALQTAH